MRDCTRKHVSASKFLGQVDLYRFQHQCLSSMRYVAYVGLYSSSYIFCYGRTYYGRDSLFWRIYSGRYRPASTWSLPRHISTASSRPVADFHVYSIRPVDIWKYNSWLTFLAISYLTELSSGVQMHTVYAIIRRLRSRVEIFKWQKFVHFVLNSASSIPFASSILRSTLTGIEGCRIRHGRVQNSCGLRRFLSK